MSIKVILENKRELGFKASVPSLPECVGHGMYEDEALENVRRAVLFYFGIEEVLHPKNWIDVIRFKRMMTQMVFSKMDTEKKQATAITLLGLFLMIAVIWTVGLFT